MSDIVGNAANHWYRMAVERELAEASEKMTEQSSTITRLRAQNAELVAALRPFVCNCSSNCAWEMDEVCPDWNARAALAKVEGEKL